MLLHGTIHGPTSSSSSIHIPSPVTGSRASVPVLPISPCPSRPPSPSIAPESPPPDVATFALAEDMSRQEHLLADLVAAAAAATLLSRARDRPPWTDELTASEVRGDRRAVNDLLAAVARGAADDKTVRNMVYLNVRNGERAGPGRQAERVAE